jgi:hypothetical protein
MNIDNTRVARGAALLDSYDPQWYDKIDLDTLDLGNTSWCVLGQLFEPVVCPMCEIAPPHYTTRFEAGLILLNLPRTGVDYGFVSMLDEDLWRDLILQRRNEQAHLMLCA